MDVDSFLKDLSDLIASEEVIPDIHIQPNNTFQLHPAGIVGELHVHEAPHPQTADSLNKFRFNPIISDPLSNHCSSSSPSSILTSLHDQLITHPSKYPNLDASQLYWPRPLDFNEVCERPMPSKPTRTLELLTDPLTGELIGHEERTQSSENFSSSLSVNRTPGDMRDFVRGSARNLPFLPGGVDLPGSAADRATKAQHLNLSDFEKPHGSSQDASEAEEALLDTPPGFSSAVVFSDWEEKRASFFASSASMVSSQAAAATPYSFLLPVLPKTASASAASSSGSVSVSKQEEEPLVEAHGSMLSNAISVNSNPAGLLAQYIPTEEERTKYKKTMRMDRVEAARRGHGIGSAPRSHIRLDELFGEDGFSEFEKQEEEEAMKALEEREAEGDEEAMEVVPTVPTITKKEKARLTKDDKDYDIEDILEDNKSESVVLRATSAADRIGSKPAASAGAAPRLGASSSSLASDQHRWQYAVLDRANVSKFDTLVPDMAMRFPFEIDTWQKEAIYHMERGECVFVAAHTSAGKTVVAEYAIALAQKHMTRAIYTSPIKTLSNQKFRDFKRTFGDVGLLTGDVQVNPTASCMIMTTEILRSMLYKGADLIRDIEWVIFDEVHYVNDAERGVVWEEVIIMLPQHVNMVFLSATVPNVAEFADWIGRTKRRPIFVTGSMKRPIPLEHHLLYGGEIFKIVDSRGNFIASEYRKCAQLAKVRKEKQGNAAQSKSMDSKMKTELQDWGKNIDAILKKKMLMPTVVFCFSKKRCEEVAYGLTTVVLTTGAEKHQIHCFLEESFSRLKGTDRELPQVIAISELLKRGLGVHHAGLLPIVKEVVEMLFSRGLVKLLFATETFAMGVNMPARSVIFNTLRKHDGKQFRDLGSGEYIQMSGRAGRRGLDTTGVVMIAVWNDEVPDEYTLQTVILGKPGLLESQFRLTHNMLLNLLRVQDFRVEDMIKRSFSEFHAQRSLPTQKTILAKMEAELKSLEDVECIFGEPDIENYFAASKRVQTVNAEMQKWLVNSNALQMSLTMGRVLVIRTKSFGHTLAMYVRPSAKDLVNIGEAASSASASSSGGSKSRSFVMMVLTPAVPSRVWVTTSSGLPPYNPLMFPSDSGIRTHWTCLDISSNDIISVSKTKLKAEISSDLSPEELSASESPALHSLATQLVKLWEQNPSEGPAPLHPVKDLGIKDLDFALMSKEKEAASEACKQSKCAKCPKLPEQFERTRRRDELSSKLSAIKYALSDSNLQLMPEFDKRVRVLQKLNYVDSDRTVQLKGRVACEINSCDELLATELIFENVITFLPPEEAVAVLSCLVCQDKTDTEPSLPENLVKPKEALINLALALGKVQMECGLDVTPEEYLQSVLRLGMMQVAYEWARGMDFAEICKLTTIPEGTIVRTISQLDQACREVRNGARVVGDVELFQKMEKCSELIRRDIVFSASLYLT